MKDKIEAFKLELEALLKKYNFQLTDIDNYNSYGEYSSTNYYFTHDNEAWYVETIDEIVNDAVKGNLKNKTN